MNKGKILQHMFPNATPSIDYVVSDDGTGQKIISWKLIDPMPSDAEMQSHWLDVLREEKRIELNKECNLDIRRGFVSASTGHTFEYDTLDQDNMSQQHAFLMRRTDILEVEWNTKDAGPKVFTRDQFFTICDESATHKWTKVNRYRELRTKLYDPLTDTESEILAIVW